MAKFKLKIWNYFFNHFYQRAALRAPLIKGSHRHSQRRGRWGAGNACEKRPVEAIDIGKYIIEVREFDSEAICDLRGCLEAVASRSVSH